MKTYPITFQRGDKTALRKSIKEKWRPMLKEVKEDPCSYIKEPKCTLCLLYPNDETDQCIGCPYYEFYGIDCCDIGGHHNIYCEIRSDISWRSSWGYSISKSFQRKYIKAIKDMTEALERIWTDTVGSELK